MTNSPDPYKALFLEPGCSLDDIKRAYRDLVKVFHPDLCSNSVQKNAFASIQNAYELIGTAEKKQAYDQRDRVPVSTGPAPAGYKPPPPKRAHRKGSAAAENPKSQQSRKWAEQNAAPYEWHQDGYRYRPKSMDERFKAKSLFLRIRMTAGQLEQFQRHLRSYTTDPSVNYAFNHFFVQQRTRFGDTLSGNNVYSFAFLGTRKEIQFIHRDAALFGVIQAEGHKADEFTRDFAKC